jgi:hypothetical protein
MNSRKSDPKFVRAYERGMLRSAFKSLFWAVISERKKRSAGYTLIQLAKGVATSKHEVSRWFNGDPNWTINTIASIANALGVDLRIEAVDRVSGEVFTPAGIQVSTVYQPPKRVTSAAPPPPPSVRVTRMPEGLRPPDDRISSAAAA